MKYRLLTLLWLGFFYLARCACASTIVGAEYFIGSDPGLGNGLPLTFSAQDSIAADLADVVIPVGSLPPGTHSLNIRVLDDQGRWSNPLIRRFTISTFTFAGGMNPSDPNAESNIPKPHKSLVQAEYFIGTDPGQGNGTSLALTGGDGLSRDLADIAVPLGNLPAGTHNVGVRVKDETGRWSNPLIRRFTLASFTLAGGVDPSDPNAANSFGKPIKPLTRAEYFIGTDPGQGNGVPLVMPSDSAGLSRGIEDAPIPLNMPPGTYDVSVRVKDEENRWSNPLKRRFTLYRTDVMASQRAGSKLVDLEYDLVDGPRNFTTVLLISQDGGQTWAVPTASVTGDVGPNVAPGRVKRMVWHAGEDWNNGFSENMRFRVVAYETTQDTPSGFAAFVPGNFNMGSPGAELGRGSDELQHTVVRSRPFYLKTTEVTWAEWNAVRSQGPAFGYTDIPVGRNGLNGDGSGNHPVTDVSWLDTVKWCNLKSEIDGKKPVYYSSASLNPTTVVRTGISVAYAFWMANGYRLPTESEWEEACRVGAATAFSNGDITNISTDPNLDAVGWYAANSGNNTHAVGGKSANAQGLFDMHGNVREWCWDTQAAYPSSTRWDPASADPNGTKVIRGGSWSLPAAACRAAARSNGGQNSRATDLGFRIALNFSGLTDVATPAGIPIDSRNPAAGNLIAGMRPVFNGSVYAMSSQPDGKIIVGGDFTTVDGLTRNRIARINADGSLDSTFNPGASSTVYSIVLQPDGKILLGGDFSGVANGTAEFVARLNADGSFDASFYSPVDYVVHCMAVQPDGKILIGGEFQFIGSTPRNRIARLQAGGSVDSSFSAGADGIVRTMALQSDRKLLIGGSFATVNGVARSNLARVNVDGTLDSTFTSGADNDVTCVSIQASGQILVGGAFASLGGQSRNAIGRLSSSGLTDSSFNPNLNGVVRSMVQQADGRLLIGGEFTTAGGVTRNRLAAFNGAGTLEAAFALDFNGAIHSLNLLPTGKLVVGGSFSSVNGVTRQGMAWIDNDAVTEGLVAMSSNRVQWTRGGAAPVASQVTFELSTDDGVSWSSLGSATRISGGWERLGLNLPAQGQLRARALIPSGRGNGSSALVSFTSPFSGLVTFPEIAVEAVGGAEILQGGAYSFGTLTTGSSKSITLVIRNLGYGNLIGPAGFPYVTVTKDGANPSDFQIISSPAAAVPGPSGSANLVIRFSPGDSGPRSAAIHIASNDTNENPFDIQLTGAGVVAGQITGDVDPNVGNRVNAISVQPDGKIIIGGAFTTVAGQPRGRFTRLNPDLSLESATTFAAGSGASGEVMAVALQPDGKILVGGNFTSITSTTQFRNRIARLWPDGSIEATDTFNPGSGSNNGANGIVRAIALQPDGKILIGGDFTKVSGVDRGRIARLNANGSEEATATFNTGSGADGIIYCIALQPDGKILLGGMFTQINGQLRQQLARLLPDGSLDTSFIADTNGKVTCLAVQPDGKILVGGQFTSIGGISRNRIARLLPSGAVESTSTFDYGGGAGGGVSSVTTEVNSIAMQADGGILIGGNFTDFNGDGRAYFARLYANGTLEDFTTFDTVVGPDGTAPLVRSLALKSDGSVVVGGDFTEYNGTVRGRLALVANQPAMDDLLVSSSVSLDWNRGGTAAEITSPTIELSTNGGGAWTSLPAPIRKVGGWESTSLSLPSSGMIRARGRTSSGIGCASSGLVEIVKSFVNAPALTTLPATSITYGSAVLNATVVPNGSANVRFEFGPTAAYGSLTSVQTVTGSTQTDLAAQVNGISGLYHFRIVAETTGGIYRGDDLTFVTAPEPPVAVTANPVSVTNSSATLVGAVNPKGRQTSVQFEYGATTLYGNTTSVQVLPAGNSATELGVAVTGLIANATYHYRIVAVSSGGTAYGSDVAFQAGEGGIPSASPSVTTGGVVNLGTVNATLQGTVNPNGGFTNAFFEYGTSNSLGSVTPSLGAGNGAVPANLSWILTGLTPGTLHFYRLVATNSAGTTRGSILTFTTNFLPPVVTTGTAVPVTTISAQVSGTVRASNDTAQVSCEYGTDGVNFPNSISALPSTVSGDIESPVTAILNNLQGGATYYYRIKAVNSGGNSFGEISTFTPAILSGLAQLFPTAPSAAQGAVTVTLQPEGISSGWRFVGEQQWRLSGTTADHLTSGDREIEFRPVANFIRPLRETVSVLSGGQPMLVELTYFDTNEGATGSLSVVLKPDGLAGSGVPVAERAQWRLLGDSDVQWRDSGTTLVGLPVGNHLVECKPVPGRATPSVANVTVQENVTTLATLTYFLADAPVGAQPDLLTFSTISTSQNLPYGYVGQIRSDAGQSTGFAVKARVVATAGHVVWDDGTLSAVTGLQWLAQHDKGTYEPKPQVPRGFYLFDGYAAARAEPGVIPGEGTPASQTLDVAALYFNEDAARGGFSGFLASDLPANEFLLSNAQKMLVGYPVDGIAPANQGRMHATPPANVSFTQGFGRTYTTTAIHSTGGNSGGPLCVQHSNGKYYPAAVYLGGSGQTVVRAFDSLVVDLFNRAEVSGNGGQNNTGGGITHSSFVTIGTSTSPGAVSVSIEPAGARAAGAGWRLSPESTFRYSGAQKTGLNSGNYTLQLNTVAGFQAPTQQSVRINGGQLSSVTFTYAVANTAPVISNISNRTINEDGTTGAIPFTVSDAESAETALVVTGTSSNQTLVPNSKIVFGGSGANRTVTVTPAANKSGTTTITLTVSDGALTDTDTWVLTVNARNDAPTISAITGQTVPANTTSGSIPFSIADTETATSLLTVTAVSTDPVLLPEANIIFSGSGANRSLTLTPAANAIGSATVTISVSDGSLSASRSFLVTVTGTPMEVWRFQYFGTTAGTGNAADSADPDGDGSNNLDEHIAGTNPNDSGDSFRVGALNKSSGSCTVGISGKTGRSYVLERALNASTGPWVGVSTVGPLISDAPVSLTDTAPPPSTGFYRIRVTFP